MVNLIRGLAVCGVSLILLGFMELWLRLFVFSNYAAHTSYMVGLLGYLLPLFLCAGGVATLVGVFRATAKLKEF